MTDTLSPPHLPQKPAKRRRRRSRFGSLFFIVVLIALGLVATGVLPVRDFLERENDVNAAQVRLDELQAENAELAGDIDALFSEQEVERIAREQYGFVRPGEIGYVVVIPDAEDGLEPDPEPVEVPRDERSLLESIWDFVTGNDIDRGSPEG